MKARDIILHVGLPLDDIVAGMNRSWLESIVPRLVAHCDLRTHQGMIPEAICWGATCRICANLGPEICDVDGSMS